MLEAPEVLFVDRTNTWGSPIAEAAFQFHAQRLGLTIQSASVGLSREFAGNRVSANATAFASRHGLDLRDHHARQLRLQDLRKFTHIVALDQESLATLRAMRSDGLSLLEDHADGSFGDFVCDPSTGEPHDVQVAWNVISSAVRNLAVGLAASSRRPPISARTGRAASRT